MRNNKFLLSTIVFLFLISVSAFSQIELENKVIDFSTMMPIENASIYIKNTTIGTVSNADGKFVLIVPKKHLNDSLIISSIGFKSFKTTVKNFNNSLEVFLEEDIASLDEIVLIATKRPQTGNEIVLKAIKELENTLPSDAFLQKGFLRHKERNKIEFKWLIESAITVYDTAITTNPFKQLKINVDEKRKSYDLRDVDSLFSYVAYLNQTTGGRRFKTTEINLSSVSKPEIVKAIKWNDTRTNGLQNIFQGKLNLLRTAYQPDGLFNKDNILSNHLFSLDTILVDNGRKLYKIKINKGKNYVDLKTKGIFNDGYHPEGWLYIYYDNYAFKKIEYNLVAASPEQKIRSKRLFDTQTNHKLVMTYMDYQDKMYPNYIYYETPKLVNVGAKDADNMTEKEKERYNKEERYYATIQEVLFSEVILEDSAISNALSNNWDMDIFSPKPYNKTFWQNYNVLLESDQDQQLILDLTRKAASLYKE